MQNPKFEARNSKQMQKQKILNKSNKNETGLFLNSFKELLFLIHSDCFGFRYSDFEFGLLADPALEAIASKHRLLSTFCQIISKM